MRVDEIKLALQQKTFDPYLGWLYCTQDPKPAVLRLLELLHGFALCFGTDDAQQVQLFSAPGRSELGGNHTDHQQGHVLAAAVNLDVLACVRQNGQQIIRVCSQGHDPVQICIDDLAPKDTERGRSASLVRGIAAQISDLGCPLQGLDIYTISSVPVGSGLSSSAAFEVLFGTVLNKLCCNGQLTPVQIAKIGQRAENAYFGKPCGLMDQTASAVGGAMTIDFCGGDPVVRKINFDFEQAGYSLCIVSTGGDHTDLTLEYGAIPHEMTQVATVLGQPVLCQVSADLLWENAKKIRDTCGDRALLRALHFCGDNQRVILQAQALDQGDFEQFLQLVNQSGLSSYTLLQNICTPDNPKSQPMAVALAMASFALGGKGAVRVHGGGFAGTIQAFVPTKLVGQFAGFMDSLLGAGSCQVLSVRPVGGIRLFDQWERKENQ